MKIKDLEILPNNQYEIEYESRCYGFQIPDSRPGVKPHLLDVGKHKRTVLGKDLALWQEMVETEESSYQNAVKKFSKERDGATSKQGYDKAFRNNPSVRFELDNDRAVKPLTSLHVLKDRGIDPNDIQLRMERKEAADAMKMELLIKQNEALIALLSNKDKSK